LIEVLASLALSRVQRRVLELEHIASLCSHVRDVLFSAWGELDELLPLEREEIFPCTVPWRLFPPRVTDKFS
jgi:hypothetical protein